MDKNFLVPFQRNPRIKGRGDFLEILKNKLKAELPGKYNHRVALHGLGGVGKTQCALEYVYANKASYQRIYWISAMDEASMLSGYQKIAELVRLPGLQVASMRSIAEAVLSWLKREQNWLIIIDNLDDIKIANGLLPESGPEKHTLITTRNPRTIGIPAEPLEVPLLSPQDSVDLLSALSNIAVQPNSDEEKQACKIVEELGYLALAIDLAAAYIRDVTGDFSAYLSLYQRNHKKLHFWVPDDNRQYSHSVATAWSVSFDIIQKNKHAASLLRLFSFLNPDEILIEFLVAGMEAFNDDLRNVVVDEHELATTILELEKFSLIKWNRRSKSISIHRLVQTVISDKISQDELTSTLDTVINLCNEAFPSTVTNETRPICRKYQSQVVEPLFRIDGIHTQQSADIKERIGFFLQIDGKYTDSSRLLLQALEIQRVISGADHPSTLVAMNNLAVAYRAQGKTAEAAALHEEVLEKRKRILGDDHPSTLMTMSNLAVTYWAQGKMADVATLHEEVLERRKRILGDDHPDTLMTMNNLAETYREEGKTAEAATLHEEVLEKSKRILGDDHPSTLMTMNNLAVTYRAQGKTAEAAALHEEVLEKRKRILGDDHPDTLMTMNNLAETYWAQGKTADVAALHEEVLEKRKRILGDDHPSTLVTMNNLAETYQAQGKTTDVATLHEEVLEKSKRILGDDHPSTLMTMNNLAETYREQGKTAEAAALHEEVLEKRKRILGDDHPSTLMTMNNLAETYREQGKMAEAAALQKEKRSDEENYVPS